MAADSTHLAPSGRAWKVPLGPMIGPNPGPTLPTAVAAPDSAVTRSSPRISSTRLVKATVAR